MPLADELTLSWLSVLTQAFLSAWKLAEASPLSARQLTRWIQFTECHLFHTLHALFQLIRKTCFSSHGLSVLVGCCTIHFKTCLLKQLRRSRNKNSFNTSFWKCLQSKDQTPFCLSFHGVLPASIFYFWSSTGFLGSLIYVVKQMLGIHHMLLLNSWGKDSGSLLDQCAGLRLDSL